MRLLRRGSVSVPAPLAGFLAVGLMIALYYVIQWLYSNIIAGVFYSLIVDYVHIPGLSQLDFGH